MISFFGHCVVVIWLRIVVVRTSAVIDDFIANQCTHVRVCNLISCHTFRVFIITIIQCSMCTGNPSFVLYEQSKTKFGCVGLGIVFQQFSIIIPCVAVHGTHSIKLCLPNVGRWFWSERTPQRKSCEKQKPLIYADISRMR